MFIRSAVFKEDLMKRFLTWLKNKFLRLFGYGKLRGRPAEELWPWFGEVLRRDSVYDPSVKRHVPMSHPDHKRPAVTIRVVFDENGRWDYVVFPYSPDNTELSISGPCPYYCKSVYGVQNRIQEGHRQAVRELPAGVAGVVDGYEERWTEKVLRAARRAARRSQHRQGGQLGPEDDHPADP